MPTPCDNCPIRTGCDYLSECCRLTPAQVVALRPDLLTVKRTPAHELKALGDAYRAAYEASHRKPGRAPYVTRELRWRLGQYIATGANAEWIEAFHQKNLDRMRGIQGTDAR
jgi:hypothetical protein